MSEKSVEVQFPMILIRIKKGLKLIELLSKLLVVRILNWFWVLLVPLLVVGGLFMIISQIFGYFSSPVVLEKTKELGPQAFLLIPGLNPFIPVSSGWVSILIALAVHELAHGVAARSIGVGVKSTGLLLFLGIPIGAFCEIDELQLVRSRARDQMKVMSAGIVSNFLIALFAILAVILTRLAFGPNEAIFSFLSVLFIVNISVAIFNALPLGPMDGGRIFKLFVAKLNKGSVRIASLIANLATILLVALLIAIPFLIL